MQTTTVVDGATNVDDMLGTVVRGRHGALHGVGGSGRRRQRLQAASSRAGTGGRPLSMADDGCGGSDGRCQAAEVVDNTMGGLDCSIQAPVVAIGGQRLAQRDEWTMDE
ncbi:hypothetical protein ACLOJK_038861 [Asimina triloba]